MTTPYTQYTEFQRLPREVMDSFKGLAAAVCHDTLAERGHSNLVLGGVRNLTPGMQVVGQAVTVRCVPTRLDLREKAAEIKGRTPNFLANALLEPGDILVMNTCGMTHVPIGGDILFAGVARTGCTALVTDGALRDIVDIRNLGLGVWARDLTPGAGPPYVMPFEVNTPVDIGGALVAPGDIIVADEDGAVVVPCSLAAEIGPLARDKQDLEAYIRDRVVSGSDLVQDIYPATEEVKREFEEYRRKKG